MKALHLRLVPERRTASDELVSAARAAYSAIGAIRRSSSDGKRRDLFDAGDRLGVALGELPPSQRARSLPRDVQEKVDAVLVAAAEYSLLGIADILGPCRAADVVDARDLVIYMLQEVGLRPQSIGRQVNKDHSSVLTSLKRGERKAAEVEWFTAGIRQIRREMAATGSESEAI
jgi:hypothetical protein